MEFTYPVHHAAVACKPVVHNVVHTVTKLVGVTYTEAGIAVALTAIVAAGLAWYIRGRGLTGVKTDITNAKTTVNSAVAAVEAKV
jgi:hypothetical protein